MRIPLDPHDAIGLRAANPGPLTLEGTNTWVVGTGDVWVIDPGPELDEHLDAVATEVSVRGQLAGIALTHSHGDHSDGVGRLVELLGDVPVVAADDAIRSGLPRDAAVTGALHGQLEVLGLPGHSRDHVVFTIGSSVAFTGDALFARSSVFITPTPGAMAGYLEGLQRLVKLDLDLIAPGHGPLIENPTERLTEQIEHRLDRERRLVEAIAAGRTTVAEMLETVWSDVPDLLRPAAAVTLTAHLGKLADEGRLPDGVEVPEIPEWVV